MMSAPQSASSKAGDPRMRKVDLSSDVLSTAQRELIASYNKKQYERFQLKHRGKTNMIGLGISAVIASIYGYTIYQMSKDNLIGELEQEVKRNEN